MTKQIAALFLTLGLFTLATAQDKMADGKMTDSKTTKKSKKMKKTDGKMDKMDKMADKKM